MRIAARGDMSPMFLEGRFTVRFGDPAEIFNAGNPAFVPKDIKPSAALAMSPHLKMLAFKTQQLLWASGPEDAALRPSRCKCAAAETKGRRRRPLRNVGRGRATANAVSRACFSASHAALKRTEKIGTGPGMLFDLQKMLPSLHQPGGCV